MTRTKKLWMIVISCVTVLALAGVLLWCFVFNNPPRRITLKFDADRVVAVKYGYLNTRLSITDSQDVSYIVNNLNGRKFVRGENWGAIKDQYDGHTPVTYLADENDDAVWQGAIVNEHMIILDDYFYYSVDEGINVSYIEEAAGL